jgi:hypothetical protein
MKAGVPFLFFLIRKKNNPANTLQTGAAGNGMLLFNNWPLLQRQQIVADAVVKGCSTVAGCYRNTCFRVHRVEWNDGFFKISND